MHICMDIEEWWAEIETEEDDWASTILYLQIMESKVEYAIFHRKQRLMLILWALVNQRK